MNHNDPLQYIILIF